MTMAVYPFWRVVADVTGRLFRLQGTVVPAQVQRRAKELLGEREVVARSARYVLRAFADWGVVSDSDRKGNYSPAPSVSIADPKVATWLLEAAVLSSSDALVDFNGLVNGPCLFPFQIGRVFPGVQNPMDDAALLSSSIGLAFLLPCAFLFFLRFGVFPSRFSSEFPYLASAFRAQTGGALLR
jgi:hypothetical protein